MQTSSSQVSKEWFKDWFNSPYYHLLYKHRDEQEARLFIDRLLELLQPPPGARILDLACGKGRFSRFLAQKGYLVTGVDIAEDSIAFARRFENENLSFFQHDMRRVFRVNYFDYIFNFFTSFGYFDNDRDHQRTVNNIAIGLRPEGRFVLDFFNTDKVLRTLKPRETKTVDGIAFHIERWVDAEGYILKSIAFEAEGRAHRYVERVKAFTLEDFQRLFGTAGLKIARTFGSYLLEPYDREHSDRLILVGCKSGC
ncbi:MAG: class I SAM-dependent methyltransferase [Bacteroidetes bacterium]|nr:MAG: class I SAM-dependent methyltransferase [Bacteroidota bacterium]